MTSARKNTSPMSSANSVCGSGIAAAEALRRRQRIRLGKENAAFGAADHRPRCLLFLRRLRATIGGAARLSGIDEPQHEKDDENDDDPDDDLAHSPPR